MSVWEIIRQVALLAGRFLLATQYVWLPILSFALLLSLWLRYIRLKAIHALDWVLLEIKVPREIIKSPQAMEVLLAALHQTADGNFLERYFKGKVRAWFSLEIASFGGDIHFYVRTQKVFKNLIESQIYSQYPEVEIYEADDYTSLVPYGLAGSGWELWGGEFKLTKADPYPIKTYIDYGLDKEVKEPTTQVDPLTPVIEFLGAIEPHEQIWFQLPVMATRERFKKPGTWFGKQDWKSEGEILVDEIMKRDPKTKASKPKGEGPSPIVRLSEGEQNVVKAISRSISKLGFDCGLRVLYLTADESKFNVGRVIGIISTVKQFNSLDLNGFKPGLTTYFPYPWQDFRGFRLARLKRKFFNNYRRRAYFYPPAGKTPFVLNSEELATIYHFPGRVAQTPTLSRIESKRAEPPVNLPL